VPPRALHAVLHTMAATHDARARRAQDGARPGASAGAADAPPDAPPEAPPEAPRPPPVRLRAFSWARRLRDGVSGALELDAPSPEPPASAGPAGGGRAGGAAWASAGSHVSAWDSAPSPAVTPRRASFPCGALAPPRPFPGPDPGAALTPVRRCPSLAVHPLPEPVSAATSMRSVGSLLDDDALPAFIAPCASQSASPGPGHPAERAGAPSAHALAPGSADSSAAASPMLAPAAGAARAPDAALLASFGSLVDALDEDAPAGGPRAQHGAMPPAASCSLGAGGEPGLSTGAAALGARGRTSSAPLLDGWDAEGSWDAFPPTPAAGEPGSGRAGAPTCAQLPPSAFAAEAGRAGGAPGAGNAQNPGRGPSTSASSGLPSLASWASFQAPEAAHGGASSRVPQGSGTGFGQAPAACAGPAGAQGDSRSAGSASGAGPAQDALLAGRQQGGDAGQRAGRGAAHAEKAVGRLATWEAQQLMSFATAAVSRRERARSSRMVCGDGSLLASTRLRCSVPQLALHVVNYLDTQRVCCPAHEALEEL